METGYTINRVSDSIFDPWKIFYKKNTILAVMFLLNTPYKRIEIPFLSSQLFDFTNLTTVIRFRLGFTFFTLSMTVVRQVSFTLLITNLAQYERHTINQLYSNILNALSIFYKNTFFRKMTAMFLLNTPYIYKRTETPFLSSRLFECLRI